MHHPAPETIEATTFQAEDRGRKGRTFALALDIEGKAMSDDFSGPKKRIVILGGGFGGVYTARNLERLIKQAPSVEIVLVSRDNFLLMTPLLFEVCSGTLDVRHCAFPVRAFLRTTRFVEATVERALISRQSGPFGSAWKYSRIGL